MPAAPAAGRGAGNRAFLMTSGGTSEDIWDWGFWPPEGSKPPGMALWDGAPADRHKCKLLACSCFKPKLSTVPAPHHTHLPVMHMRVGSACPRSFLQTEGSGPLPLCLLAPGHRSLLSTDAVLWEWVRPQPCSSQTLALPLALPREGQSCTASLVTAQIPCPGTSHSGTLSTPALP